MKTLIKKNYTATQNACKLCTPLGAALAFQGMEGCVPLLHGSQGCSTYMRRYLISHFKEPVDIASSNFSEETAIFGGGSNLKTAIENVVRQYSPKVVGIATTCLSETIGDDVELILSSIGHALGETALVHVSTPSYTGTHMDGFHQAVKAVVDQFNPATTRKTKKKKSASKKTPINIFPGMLSNEDLRHIKEILADMQIPHILLPDYSERLEGPPWSEYQVIQEGGTPIESIKTMKDSAGSITFGRILDKGGDSAGKLLEERWGVPCRNVLIPMGIRAMDQFFNELEKLTGKPVPEKYKKEKGRLLDAYVDGNKYISRRQAIVYGEEDFVLSLACFLAEIGIIPVLCASGGKSGFLEASLKEILPKAVMEKVMVRDGVDFMEIEQEARESCPDLIIGNSKGYAMARKLKIPLVRVGFPIHDRVGGSRILHIGYRGAQQLFDLIINTLLRKQQEMSDIGYSYM